MSGDLLPLPAKLTANRIAAASPEQRAAWLAEADATAPARAARMRETLAQIEAPKASDLAAAPLPVGEDRETAVRRYEMWQDAQVALGRESCPHGEALTRTCLACFDGRCWIVTEGDLVPPGADTGTGDIPPWSGPIYEATEAVTESLRTAGESDEEEAREEAQRLVGIVEAAVRADIADPEYPPAKASDPWLAHMPPADVASDIDDATPVVVADRLAIPDGREFPAGEIDLRVEALAANLARLEEESSACLRRHEIDIAAINQRCADTEARLLALEQRPPVVAPPAIPAHMAERLEIAEGKAESARRAVEALTKRVDDAIAQGDGLYRALTHGTMSVSEAAKAFDEAAKSIGEKAHEDFRAAVAAATACKGETVYVAPSSPARVLRCSSLPLFRACSASMDRTPEMILVESTGEPARLGTAVHEVAAHMIFRGREAAGEIIADVAARHDVDAEDLGYLAYQAAEAWEALRSRFPHPTVEGEVSMALDGGARLDGHPDLYAIDGRALRIDDLKSGRLRYDTREQLLGYALLVLWTIFDNEQAMRASLDLIELYTSWLRPEHGGIQRLVFTVEEVIAWGRDLAKRATATPLPYSPGPHCVQCPRCADCPAKAAWVRQTVAEFAPGGTTAEALAAARAIGKLAAQAIEAIRTQATTAGIDGVKVTEERRVSVRLAHPAVPQAIREALGSEATAAGGKVRGAMLKVMGLKGADADEEMSRLEAAGAAKVTVSKKVAGEE